MTNYSTDPQGSPEWLTERVGKITASRAADMMAISKKGEPLAARRNLFATLVVERITGRSPEVFVNEAMRRGTALEGPARALYCSQTGADVSMVGMATIAAVPYVGASPDGLVDSDGLLEIKCPWSMEKHLDALLHGSHAEEYHWQVQHQLWITGRDWCDVVSYDDRWPAQYQLAIRRVGRDEEAIKALQTESAKLNAEVTAAIADLDKQLLAWGV